MRVLDLFSGIGGFSLGLERAGMETIAFCEIDPFCRKVLRKHWPDVPIHEDIRELDGNEYRGAVDVVCGGFPCQPFSAAGKRAGAEDDRHLWPEMLRVIRQVQPAWVLGENVPGIISMELDAVLSDLEASGYACQTFDIPACGVDAPHIRHRVWILANRSGERRQQVAGGSHGDEGSDEGRAAAQAHVASGDGERCGARYVADPGLTSEGRNAELEAVPGRRQQGSVVATNGGQDVADAEGGGARRRGQRPEAQYLCRSERTGACTWLPEPPVGRVANGIPRRVDRLRALGNSVVPQVVEQIGRAIIGTAA